MSQEQFPILTKKYDLHNSPQVESSIDRKVKRSLAQGNSLLPKEIARINSDKDIKVQVYMERLGEITNRKNATERESGLNAAKRKLRRDLIILRQNIPQSVFELVQRIALEQGHGVIEITDEYKEIKSKEIIDAQEKSLDAWVDYLTGPDAFYKDEFKYIAFRSIIKMGGYNKEKGEFEKRSKTSTKPFPEINSEALGIVEQMIKFSQPNYKGERPVMAYGELNEQLFDAPEIKKLSKSAQFEKLYPIVIHKLDEQRRKLEAQKDSESKEEITGSWTKFDMGGDYSLLEGSLQGYCTGWCTAIGSAKYQLEIGDFYVFYSKDKDGNDKLPRIAIRMQGEQIGEIRGVNANQELEPEAVKIMEEKASTLGGYEPYQKKVDDMKRLTDICNKDRSGEELRREDLKFLYEVDNKIEGFGYRKDPRIKELKTKRNHIKDLSLVYNCNQNEISTTFEELQEGNIKIHFGNLSISNDYLVTSEFVFPEILHGNLSMTHSKFRNITLPKEITGNVYLNHLDYVKDTVFPEKIGGDLELCSLESVDNLKLPNEVGGDLLLSDLISAKGLVLPKKLYGTLELRRLKSIEGLDLPEDFNFGNLDIKSELMLELQKKRDKKPNNSPLNILHNLRVNDKYFNQKINDDESLKNFVWIIRGVAIFGLLIGASTTLLSVYKSDQCIDSEVSEKLQNQQREFIGDLPLEEYKAYQKHFGLDKKRKRPRLLPPLQPRGQGMPSKRGSAASK
jgi:hypothetical protein